MNKTFVSISTIALIATGCATNTPGLEENVPDEASLYDTALTKGEDLVASNFIYAMAQLPGLRPIQTTVQMTEPNSTIGDSVKARLNNAGYGIQMVDTDLGPHFVRYKLEQSVTERGPITRYSMSVGGVELHRDFAMIDGEMVPDSALEISGASKQFIELNDAVFAKRGNNYVEDVVFKRDDNPVLETLQESAKVDDYIDAVKQNMYETRRTNFQRLFDSYDDVESVVMVFQNDSMVLGKANKRIVSAFARKMNPETDLISVIGCSHGISSIKNGNSVLAVGRANRVKEAFVFAGVEYGKVMDEGCWAPRHFDEMMPRRGVVLTLKRRKE